MKRWRVPCGVSGWLPVSSACLSAGFPSPADDHLDGQLDVTKLLIENEPATFLVRVSGDSMEGVGIYHGDIVVVNRALAPRDRSLIVAEVYGEFTLKRLRILRGKHWLYAENPRYPPVQILADMGFTVWGVVKHSIRIHDPQRV